LTALMAIHDRVPRVWTDYEQALIGEVTERCWAHIQRVQANAEVREAMAALEALNATLEHRVEERTHPVAAHRSRTARHKSWKPSAS
jgi:GAF domain-containing protein